MIHLCNFIDIREDSYDFFMNFVSFGSYMRHYSYRKILKT